MEQHNKPVCELLCIDFCNKYEEQKSTIRELEARIAALTKDAEPATTCPRIELVVAIHSLASDFENMSYSFGADTEDRKRAQGSIKHAMAVASKHNQNGAGCITHPPAPKAITASNVDADIEYWRQKYLKLDAMYDELEKEKIAIEQNLMDRT